MYSQVNQFKLVHHTKGTSVAIFIISLSILFDVLISPSIFISQPSSKFHFNPSVTTQLAAYPTGINPQPYANSILLGYIIVCPIPMYIIALYLSMSNKSYCSFEPYLISVLIEDNVWSILPPNAPQTMTVCFLKLDCQFCKKFKHF